MENFVKCNGQERYEAEVSHISEFKKVAVQVHDDDIEVSLKKNSSWTSAITIPKTILQPEQKITCQNVISDPYRGDCLAECQYCNSRNAQTICDFSCKETKNNGWCEVFTISDYLLPRLTQEMVKRFYRDHAKKEAKMPRNIRGKTPLVDITQLVGNLKKASSDDWSLEEKKVWILPFGRILEECQDCVIKTQQAYGESRAKTIQKLQRTINFVENYVED